MSAAALTTGGSTAKMCRSEMNETSMLTRLIDFLKVRRVTALFTSLTVAGGPAEGSEALISSLMDTWILTELVEVERTRRRSISVLKSRGMAHSNDVRDFRITERGIEILATPAGVGGGR